MILLLDNYDSFTFNLYQMLAGFVDSVLVKRNDQITVAEVCALSPKQIVISPGPKAPQQAGVALELIEALAPTTPILGICLGHQCLAQAFGANVIAAPQVVHGKTARIRHNSEGIFTGVPQDFTATRYHSLCVDAATLPDGLQITARSDDGVVMALRHKSWPCVGLQFHPESVLTTVGPKLVQNFLEGVL